MLPLAAASYVPTQIMCHTWAIICLPLLETLIYTSLAIFQNHAICHV